MNRMVFLNELRFHLKGASEREIQDILRDQEEYISDAIRAGRSEEDVIRGLGDPKTLAKSLVLESKIEQVEKATTVSRQAGSLLGVLVAILALAPLNLFFALVPAILILTFLVMGWVLSLTSLIATVSILLAFLFIFLFLPVGFFTHLSTLFLFLGAIGVGCLGILFMAFVTKWVARGFLHYVKWNLNFVRGRA